jgi:hypothetical protein
MATIVNVLLKFAKRVDLKCFQYTCTHTPGQLGYVIGKQVHKAYLY